VTLFDFADPAAARAFVKIDDVVMGGRSASRMSATGDGTAVFSGNVSLENNGGFASVRSLRQSWDLSEAGGLTLEILGDGRRYKVNLRTDNVNDQMSYQAGFDTADGEWQTVELPFQRFAPKLRGRALVDVAPLDPGRVSTLGLMIADRQAGEFRLELRSIRTLHRSDHQS
jgi:monofunctional biosynthetic peptidoglycan transglycosylase